MSEAIDVLERRKLQLDIEAAALGQAAALGRRRVGEGRLRSPQSEACRISEVVDVRGARRRGVENPGARSEILQADAGDALDKKMGWRKKVA